MEPKYIIELSDLNVFFLSLGGLMLGFIMATLKWRLNKKQTAELNDLHMKISDLESQKRLLIKKNIDLENAAAALKYDLRQARRKKN